MFMVSLTVLTDFPMDPHLQISENILETNNEMPIECEVAGVFPAEEAQFDLTFAGESLNFRINISGDRVTAYAQVSSSSSGEYELNCAVSLGPVTKTTAKTVHIYSKCHSEIVRLITITRGTGRV